MPVCAHAIQQPDGSYLLGLDPSETNPSNCAYVVETGTESLIGSIADLSLENALVIAVAASAVWAIAWAFRQLARSIVIGSLKNESQDD